MLPLNVPVQQPLQLEMAPGDLAKTDDTGDNDGILRTGYCVLKYKPASRYSM